MEKFDIVHQIPKKRLVTGILFFGAVHHKNLESLFQDCLKENVHLKRLDESTMKDAMDENSVFNVIWFFSGFQDPSRFPKSKFIIAGPHEFVFPEGILALSTENVWQSKSWSKRARYVVPSQWVKDGFDEIGKQNKYNYGNTAIPTCVLPFTIQTHLLDYIPEEKKQKERRMFIYIKRRHPKDVKFVIDILHEKYANITDRCEIFVYGKYANDIFINYVKTCSFGIWIGTHESQCFGLIESLALNVPLFIYEATSMHYEYENNHFTYEKKRPLELRATTIPYFDFATCGSVFYEEKEFEPKFFHFVCFFY